MARSGIDWKTGRNKWKHKSSQRLRPSFRTIEANRDGHVPRSTNPKNRFPKAA